MNNNHSLRHKGLVLTLALGWLLGCGPAPEKLGSLDLVKWREDQNGCKNVRAKLIKDLKAIQQTEIKGRSANEIGTLLGIPDRQQLADRSQKYYVYFVAPGQHCKDRKTVQDSPSVAIRFSAMGIATEVTYQNGMP